MGNYNSSQAHKPPKIGEGYESGHQYSAHKGRKRHFLEGVNDSGDSLLEVDSDSPGNSDSKDEILNTPRRKKMRSTSKYIYETLFLRGEDSDITLKALGRDWPLHKLYLCQSGYFASMFSGSWRESNESVIEINIPDSNIDVEAFQTALGSFYTDEVVIKPSKVVAVLATASLIQLDGLIEQCANIMLETITDKTVCFYHQAALNYGLSQVTTRCFQWLEQNVMPLQSIALLRSLSIDIMEALIRSPKLFVEQVEMDVYTLLKKWLYLKLNPCCKGNDMRTLSLDANSFFRKRKEGTGCAGEFLDSEEGRPFRLAFHNIRYQYIINDLSSTRTLDRDFIIPQVWLFPLYKLQWQTMLNVESGNDTGPTELSLGEFERLSLRCGRMIQRNEPDGYCWRWTGFNYGVDLLFSFRNWTLYLKRNVTRFTVHGSISMQRKRSVMLRASVSSRGNNYQISTPLTHMSLEKDQEVELLSVDQAVAVFPLQISVQFISMTPKVSAAEMKQMMVFSQ